MTSERIDLGESTEIAAVLGLVPVAGLELLDIGCGAGATSRALVQAGAKVVGIEPDPVQAEKNRQAEPLDGLTFLEGEAQALPFADDSVDGVLFFRSLHHVPIPLMHAALREAARVLKPQGFLCIVEPGMTGSHFAVMRPFHDETEVRTAALAALARTTPALFTEARHYGYVQFARYPHFNALVERVLGQTFNDISRQKVETPEVRALFEAGRTAQGDYLFDQPMSLDLFRGLRTGN